MRLGLAVACAAAVVGGYLLVNAVASRPTPADEAAPAAQAGSGWRPGPIGEADAEIRSYELIRYVNPDGSLGMTDDPRRVPPGAKITGRERRIVAQAKPPAEEEPADPHLPPAHRPRSSEAEQLDELERERRAAPPR
jgi:hypothetical protein